MLIVHATLSLAVTKNGFDLDGAVVPVDEIHRGGPPRDGIPALTNPSFVAPEAARLAPRERVLGVAVSGIARAYPIKMLNVHEIVNDRIGRQHFAVTYCPLCGSGVVFATNVGEAHLNFGVSGLLYNSDLLLYDRNTESLWSQLTGSAIAGRLVGVELPVLPVVHTTWADWRERHPDTRVLEGAVEFRSAYRRDPYPGYAKTRRLYFPVSAKAPRTFHPKEEVLGVVLGGAAKAYPFVELEKHGAASLADVVGGMRVTIRWNAAHRTAEALNAAGEPIPATTLYWFAWYAFHPETLVFHAAVAE